MPRPVRHLLAAAVCGALLLPACGGTDDAAARPAPAPTTPTAAPTAPTAVVPGQDTPEPAPPTQAPATAADVLVEETRANLVAWTDISDAEAAGYRSIGDAITGHEHLVQWDWAEDEVILDPTRPESLVYEVGPGGARELVSAMYLLPPGSTMDDVPDLGDADAVWHTHDNLCWSADRRVVGLLIDDRCVPEGEPAPSVPMMHVWLVDHPCGPFAALEGHGDTSTCAAHDH
jgi:hypothetical protein